MTSKHRRRAGVLVPVSALRREGDLGIGDTAALRQLVDWAADHGVGFLQLLPINETGSQHSPYDAISSVALDPTLLALDEVEELVAADLAGARAAMPEQVFDGVLIDHVAVKLLKRGLLETAFSRFWETLHAGARWEAFTRFREEEDEWLDDYCRFRWLMDHEGGSEEWNLWSLNYNRPEAAREWIDRKLMHPNGSTERELAYFAWVQWIAFNQWRALRAYADERDVLLMGDVSIGVAYCSADVFFEPQWFDLGWFGGAPPERFFKDDPFAVKWGQNWGIPLYRWDVLEENDFRWWRRRIEKLTDVFGIFRIDHILGFYRIYAFPWRPRRNAEFLPLDRESAARRTGGKLPGFLPRPDDTRAHRDANLADGDRYLRILQDAAGDHEVVGEDLGTVPDYVRPHLLKIGIAGFKILHWEVERDKDGEEHPIPPENYDKCSFSTYATHDHPPLAAMWDDFRADLESTEPAVVQGAVWNLRILSELADFPIPKDRRSYRAFNRTIKWALLRTLLAANSDYAALMITDLFGRKERFNVPGTVGGANWRVRLPFTVEEMATDANMEKEARQLAMLIEKTQR